MSINNYSLKPTFSFTQNLKRNNEKYNYFRPNKINNKTNFFLTENRPINEKKFIPYKFNSILRDRNINNIFPSYKYNSILKDKNNINVFPPSLIRKSKSISFLYYDKDLFKQLYYFNFKNNYKCNINLKSSSYNNNKIKLINLYKRERKKVFSVSKKENLRKIYKNPKFNNFYISLNISSNNLKAYHHYKNKLVQNKIGNYKTQNNNTKMFKLIKYDKDNHKLENSKTQNFNTLYEISTKKKAYYKNNYFNNRPYQTNKNHKNYSNENKKIFIKYFSEKNNIEKEDFKKDEVIKIKERELIESNNNNLKDKINNKELNNNLVIYLNKYKGNQKKYMEECIRKLNYNYIDDNYNYNYKINYNELNIGKNNNLNENNDNKINEFNKENIDHLNNDNFKDENNNKEKHLNFKKINIKKHKNKNIEINFFNSGDNSDNLINKKNSISLTAVKNGLPQYKSLFLEDFESNLTTAKMENNSKTKLEYLLSKIPRHYKKTEIKKINYINNINRYLNEKKNDTISFLDKYLSKSRLIHRTEKNKTIMPPNNYYSEFIKKDFKNFS